MEIIRTAAALRERLEPLRAAGRAVGFVPTMGSLHAGHTSLVTLSKSRCDVTVCSIFVNPTQFNDPNDLAKYPRNEAADVALLEAAGCDVVYLPEVIDVYPDGLNALVDFDLSPLDSMLEGASRPGHFKGVANVVKRLLDIVQPDVLFLGQKDFQQVAVIKRLIENTGLKTKVVTGDIVREGSGLAMSSRNVRLNENSRSAAGKIHEALQHLSESFQKTPWWKARDGAAAILKSIPNGELDYLELRDAATLEKIEDWNDVHQAVCLVAISVDGVRLIDNALVGER
ncbi:MAG TPA: pantoate--beta-alanine ligase [Chitinophagales bacterium]|nr:pantoate--beta-alanine ligase [Chitinophagales bacterium]